MAQSLFLTSYDNHGNLTKDLNKGISNISYNSLSLPQVVTFSNGNTITYLYAADGRKLRTVHVTNGIATTTDYCGNVIYENGIQKLLLTEEGYVDLVNSNTYYYYLKDHQGNNRVVVSSSGTVMETNHYYPFGGVFSTSNIQPYKYNGKELDTKNGLNWYDYGARHYDAALGRWHVVDPLAEKYYSSSPFVYCNNNPIKYVDPNGMFYDGYTMDENGYMERVNDEGENEYDVIYSKSKYSSETIKDYDTSGNKTGIKISKGVIDKKAGQNKNFGIRIVSPEVDSENNPTGKVTTTNIYVAKDDTESLALMNFFDKNTNVEWSNTLLKNSSNQPLSLLLTSHEMNIVRLNGYVINKYIRKGYNVIRADHIHPNDTINKVSDDDKDSATWILKRSPNAKFRILHKGKYYNY